MWRTLRQTWQAVTGLVSRPVQQRTPQDALAALKRAAATSRGAFDADIGSYAEQPVEALVKGGDETVIEAAATAAYTGADGGKRDVNRARALWKARAHADATAAFRYAMCVREGDKINAPDPRHAAELLRELAEEKKHPQATYSLGVLLTELTEGKEANEKEALQRFMAAARLGVTPALYNAANMVASGRGRERDDVKALKLYEIAAETGDPEANFAVGSWYCAGRGRPNAVPDWDKGFVHHQRASFAGLAKAHYNLGTHYFTGNGTKQNFELASGSFKLAADAGIPEAKQNYANMLEIGLGVPRDKALAAQLREEVSEAQRAKVAAQGGAPVGEETKSTPPPTTEVSTAQLQA